MAKSVAISVDRLVVLPLDEGMPEDEAIGFALLHAAEVFGRMMDDYFSDPDGETLIVLEFYGDEEDEE